MNKSVLEKISELKTSAFEQIEIGSFFIKFDYELFLLTEDCSKNLFLMDLLGKWRKENEIWFLSQFEVSTERTTSWFKNKVIAEPDRMLFIIKADGTYLGHVGLFRFDFLNRTCEIDNVLRGTKSNPGVIFNALICLMNWAKAELKLDGFTLKVLSDNERAIRLYKRIGFVDTERIPLIQIEGKDGLELVEAPKDNSGPFSRYYNVMSNLKI
jgi:RimJ/RimL family protein N-acetyltransferase